MMSGIVSRYRACGRWEQLNIAASAAAIVLLAAWFATDSLIAGRAMLASIAVVLASQIGYVLAAELGGGADA